LLPRCGTPDSVTERMTAFLEAAADASGRIIRPPEQVERSKRRIIRPKTPLTLEERRIVRSSRAQKAF
jgi:hypothetical protein